MRGVGKFCGGMRQDTFPSIFLTGMWGCGICLPFCSFFAPVPSSFVIIDLPSPLILTLRSGVLNNSQISVFKDIQVRLFMHLIILFGTEVVGSQGSGIMIRRLCEFKPQDYQISTVLQINFKLNPLNPQLFLPVYLYWIPSELYIGYRFDLLEQCAFFFRQKPAMLDILIILNSDATLKLCIFGLREWQCEQIQNQWFGIFSFALRCVQFWCNLIRLHTAPYSITEQTGSFKLNHQCGNFAVINKIKKTVVLLTISIFISMCHVTPVYT